jgi:hypothetical protein
MIWEGAREDWEAAPPRPWLAARRLIAMVLGLVCGVELVILLWVIL